MTNLIPAVELVDGHPRVSSLSISEHFEKRHADVLTTIRKTASECPSEFNERNFSSVNFTDEKGESRPMYLMSRDGFTLVAMGFTGKKALSWKVRYIEAFNAMERALLTGAHGEPVHIPLTPSTTADRVPLRSLVHAWSQVAGQPHQALWPQVKAHFQLSRIDDLPAEWIPDALAFVQSKIDALPKALPEPRRELRVITLEEQLDPLFDDIKSHINAIYETEKRLFRILRCDVAYPLIHRLDDKGLVMSGLLKGTEEMFNSLNSNIQAIKSNAWGMIAAAKMPN